jgi:YgiT-type zinc finger domain-containing protein
MRKKSGKMTNMKNESCEYCDGKVHAKKVTVQYRYKGRLVIIENVPAGVCRGCGERYYDATTLEKMEAIVRLKKAAKRRVVVPIRNFAEAAA